MTYLQKLRSRFRVATREYVPAMRVLGGFTELELADKAFVKEHLQYVGLTEMSGIVAAMNGNDYDTFVQEIEDTSDDNEEFH